MPKKKLCAIRQNTIILLRFNNSDRNVFVNTDEGNFFFFFSYFSNNVAEAGSIGLKISKSIEI